MSPDDRLTVDDVVLGGGCPSGIRRWFTAKADELPEGLTLRRFLREGMSLDHAASFNDPFLNRALSLKESRLGR